MENQVLTIEQMKHLKELGCDISGASMKFISIYPSCDYFEEHEDEDFIPTDSRFHAKRYDEGGLTFTLQDILNRLPPLLHISSWEYGGALSVEGSGPVHTLTINRDKECCTIGYQFGNSYFGVGRGKTFIEAAYEAFCELLKRGIVE